MAGGQDSCPSCRGHGWKFLTLRRSPANAGATAEHALLRRARVTCLTCSGTGRSAT
jgi:DnaJ-class molecular chaperone